MAMAETGLVGRTVGGCRLERLLARGGMSATHQGTHLGLELPVVVKTLDPWRAWGRSGLVDAFVREGKALGAVIHPHVVRVLSAGTEGRIPYLVLEYLPGPSLRVRLREGRPEPAAAVELIAQAARGLGAAHAAGIVHGDVKPDNLLLDAEGRVKVVDFGLARTSGEPVQAQGGAVYGTPAYMAPELVRGAALEPPVDVYALGVTLYEALCDRWPFNAPSPIGILQKHLEEPPPLDPLRAAGLPEPLVGLVARCLAKSPDERPESAAALADALAAIDPAPPPARVRRRRRRGGRSSGGQVARRASSGRHPARRTSSAQAGLGRRSSGGQRALAGGRRSRRARRGGGPGAGLVVALVLVLAAAGAVGAALLLLGA